jgi:hypothetical protein
MGVPIDLNQKEVGKSTKTSTPSSSSSSSKSSPQEDIKLTASDLLGEQSAEKVEKEFEKSSFRNTDANYIKEVSQGEARQSNESKAQDKIAKMFEDQYISKSGDSFFDIGYELGKTFDKKRQAKAEKAGFDNIADYKSAMKEGRQVNRTNRKQERKEDKQAKKTGKATKSFAKSGSKIEKRGKKRTY